jgi:hypothetical protein
VARGQSPRPEAQNAAVKIYKTGPDITAPASDKETAEPAAPKPAKPPVATHTVAAEYPDLAEQRRLNGQCTVSALIDTKGVPREIKVVKCTNPLFSLNSYAAVNLYRFKPAQAEDGTPMAVRIAIEIHYGMFEGPKPMARVRYSFKTPPGTVNPAADANGVYPLTQQITLPVMNEFSDIGLGIAAFGIPEGTACDVILTIAANGRASDESVTHCDETAMEKSVVASLQASRFKPGKLKGQPVAVRVSMHLAYIGPADPHQD